MGSDELRDVPGQSDTLVACTLGDYNRETAFARLDELTGELRGLRRRTQLVCRHQVAQAAFRRGAKAAQAQQQRGQTGDQQPRGKADRSAHCPGQSGAGSDSSWVGHGNVTRLGRDGVLPCRKGTAQLGSAGRFGVGQVQLLGLQHLVGLVESGREPILDGRFRDLWSNDQNLWI